MHFFVCFNYCIYGFPSNQLCVHIISSNKVADVEGFGIGSSMPSKEYHFHCCSQRELGVMLFHGCFFLFRGQFSDRLNDFLTRSRQMGSKYNLDALLLKLLQ